MIEYLGMILAMSGIFGILTMSLDLMVGYTGIPNLGQAAFALIGGYASALLGQHFGLPPWLTIWLGGATAAGACMIVAYPTIKLEGDYLALATLGFALIAEQVANNWVGLTRGPMGLPGLLEIKLPGLSTTASGPVIIWAMVGLSYFLLSRVVESPFGRVLRGIREDSLIIETLGKNVEDFKLKVFVLGSFLAGLAGALYAHYVQFMDPTTFSVMESVTILLMAILGGLGNLRGALLGAVCLTIIPEGLRFLPMPMEAADYLRRMIFGGLLIILIYFRPQGLAGRFRWDK